MAGRAASTCWVDGALRETAAAAVRPDDLAFTEGRGCYTTARIRAGRARFEERHLQRLARGARALGLGEVDAEAVRRCFRELADAAFSHGEGIVRIQASRDGSGDTHLVGLARDLGDGPARWAAITAPLPHEGPILAGGHKLTNRLVLALATDAATAAGADEALLFDREGFLVEGTRSNLVAALPDGRLLTPPLARGLVAGIAREVCFERVPELQEGDLALGDLRDASELIAINCVRGACAITELDGAPVGSAAGAGRDLLATALERD